GQQRSFKIVTHARVSVLFKVCSHVEQFTGYRISQSQINCRSAGVCLPGAGIGLVERYWVDYETPHISPVFLVAAAWIVVFRFSVVEVPQPLLAGNCAMTVEHEQFRRKRSE